MVEEASTRSGMSIGTGLTIVIGAWIAGAIMGADIMRFTRSVKAVVICAAACFILTNPLPGTRPDRGQRGTLGHALGGVRSRAGQVAERVARTHRGPGALRHVIALAL